MSISSISLFKTNSRNVSNFHSSAELTSSSIFSNNSIDDEKARALRELDNKKASNGMTYSDARNHIYRIKKYYMHQKETCKRIIPANELFGQPEICCGLDPEKLPDKDKEIFYRAKAAIEEIEHQYPELAVRAGVDFRYVRPEAAHIEIPPSNDNLRCKIGDTLEITISRRDPGFMLPGHENSSLPDDPGFNQPVINLDRFTDIFTDLF